MSDIDEVITTKTIRSTGTSLMISITQEAGHLGLEKGDLVEVILRRVQ